MGEIHKFIAARQFVLMDEDDSPRASLQIDDGGQAAISFLDRDGHNRMVAGVGKDGLPVIGLHTGDRQICATIRMDKDGEFQIVSFDKAGKNQFQLRVSNDGSSALLFIGADPNNNIMLGVEKGKTIAKLGAKTAV